MLDKPTDTDVRILYPDEFFEWLHEQDNQVRARVTITTAQLVDRGHPIYIGASAAYFAEQTGARVDDLVLQLSRMDDQFDLRDEESFPE